MKSHTFEYESYIYMKMINTNYIKNCPNCNQLQYYKNDMFLKRAKKANQLCKKCATITWSEQKANNIINNLSKNVIGQTFGDILILERCDNLKFKGVCKNKHFSKYGYTKFKNYNILILKCSKCNRLLQSRNIDRTITYNSWYNMTSRCRVDNTKYDDRWNLYYNFLDDMGEKPGKDYIFCRINDLDEYKKSNCVWMKKEEYYKNHLRKMLNVSNSETLFFDKCEELFSVQLERQYNIRNKFFDARYKNILIEIDGSYWHDNGRNKNDLIKEKLASDNGFKLYRLKVDSVNDVDNKISSYFNILNEIFNKN